MKTSKFLVIILAGCIALAITPVNASAIAADGEASLEKVIYMLQVLTGVRDAKQALAERGAGVIEGRVVRDSGDSTVWEPIQDADIICQTENGDLPPVKTDQNGYFRLTDMPSGPKVINVFKPGYAPVRADVMVEEGAVSSIIIRPKPADVQTVGGVEGMILTPSTSDQPSPVADASVKISPASDELTSVLTDSQTPVDMPPVKSDRNGYFRFHNIPVGSYLIAAHKPDFKKAIGVVRVSAEKIARTDLILFPENAAGLSSLFGRVVENLEIMSSACEWQNFVPVSKASVSLVADNKIIQSAETGDKGIFHFAGIPAGSYVLKIDHPSFKAYETPVDIKNDDAGCLPTIMSSDDLTGGSFGISRTEDSSGVMNQFMSFITNFGGGCFCIDPNGNWHPGVNFIRIVLERTAPRITSLGGYVYAASDSERKPLVGAVVSAAMHFPYPTLAPLLTDSTDPSFVPPPVYTVVTGDNGYYKFSELPQGEYKVQATAEGYHAWENIVKVSEGTDNIFSILMIPATEQAFLKGHVYSGSGMCTEDSGAAGDRCADPVSNAVVYLFSHLQAFTDQAAPSYKTTTDESGYYAFPKIEIGEFRIMVKAEGFLYRENIIKINPGENIADVTLFPMTDCEAGCAESEYCAKPTGKCDDPGVCVRTPEACIELFAPVCGCDGKTYENACFAAASGVSIRHEGKCFSESPGSLSGHVYQLTPSSEKHSVSDAKILLNFFTPDGQYLTFQTYSDADGFYKFSELRAGGYTMVVEAAGFSAWKQEIRIISEEPVQKDVFLLPVSAFGSLNGTVTDNSSGCAGQDCPGIPNAVVAVFSAEGDFKTESDADGNYAMFQLPSGEYRMIVKAEGYHAAENVIRIEAGENIRPIGLTKVSVCKDDAGCPSDHFCSKPPGDCNGEGVCVKKQTDAACIMLYDPVCGCNGKTYGNSCEAWISGANIAYKGVCLLNR